MSYPIISVFPSFKLVKRYLLYFAFNFPVLFFHPLQYFICSYK